MLPLFHANSFEKYNILQFIFYYQQLTNWMHQILFLTGCRKKQFSNLRIITHIIKSQITYVEHISLIMYSIIETYIILMYQILVNFILYYDAISYSNEKDHFFLNWFFSVCYSVIVEITRYVFSNAANIDHVTDVMTSHFEV